MTMETDSNDRTWGMLCHLAALSGYLITPVGWILGPLIVWLVKRNESPFVDDQGKESLNFQITMIIAACIIGAVGILTCGIGLILAIPLAIALAVINIIFPIIAAIQASHGEYYRYPFSLRLIQ